MKSDEYSWKMFRGNVMRTGISSSNLSRRPHLQWVIELGPIVASPAVDNGILYAATITGRIFALQHIPKTNKMAFKHRQPYGILTFTSRGFVNSCHI